MRAAYIYVRIRRTICNIIAEEDLAAFCACSEIHSPCPLTDDVCVWVCRLNLFASSAAATARVPPQCRIVETSTVVRCPIERVQFFVLAFSVFPVLYILHRHGVVFVEGRLMRSIYREAKRFNTDTLQPINSYPFGRTMSTLAMLESLTRKNASSTRRTHQYSLRRLARWTSSFRCVERVLRAPIPCIFDPLSLIRALATPPYLSTYSFRRFVVFSSWTLPVLISEAYTVG